MPTWITVILVAGAVVSALVVLWTKALKPGARVISQAERTVPLLQKLTDVFGADPSLFNVLEEIAAEFRTNAGSSLRDAVDRLERLANEAEARDAKLEHDLELATAQAKAAADVLKVNVEAARQLADNDRARISELLVLLGRVSANVDVNKVQVGAIAEDLQASHERADAHIESEPGSAADAFSKRPAEEGDDE